MGQSLNAGLLLALEIKILVLFPPTVYAIDFDPDITLSVTPVVSFVRPVTFTWPAEDQLICCFLSVNLHVDAQSP